MMDNHDDINIPRSFVFSFPLFYSSGTPLYVREIRSRGIYNAETKVYIGEND